MVMYILLGLDFGSDCISSLSLLIFCFLKNACVRVSPNGTIGNFTDGTIGSQWYNWLTIGTNGITNGTIGITNGTIGRTLNDIGTIGRTLNTRIII